MRQHISQDIRRGTKRVFHANREAGILQTSPLGFYEMADWVLGSKRVSSIDRVIACVRIEVYVSAPKADGGLRDEFPERRFVVAGPVVVKAVPVVSPAGILEGVAVDQPSDCGCPERLVGIAG